MTTDPTNVTRWKHKFGYHNIGVQWDTPMSKWAGEGETGHSLWLKTAPQGRRDDQSTRDDETCGR